MGRRFPKHNQITLKERPALIYRFLRMSINIFAFFLVACQGNNLNSVSTPKQESVYPIENVLQQKTFQSFQPMPYKGLTPGESRREDILKVMGTPNVAKKYNNYESLHYFITYDSLVHGQEYFLVKNDVLVAVTSNLHNWKEPSVLDELPARFPNANVIQPPFGSETYVLPQHGLAFSTNTYQFFVPMKFEEYSSLWKNYPINVDPFPIDEISLDNKEVIPGKANQSDLIKLFGLPDRIIEESTNVRWLYMIEADTYGQLDISFGKDQIMDEMFIENMQKSFSLQEALVKYGKPDIVQLMKVQTANTFDSVSFVYLQRGLRLSSYCSVPDCKSGSLKLLLGQKWFFPPVSPEKYRSLFPDATFIEWENFYSNNK